MEQLTVEIRDHDPLGHPFDHRVKPLLARPPFLLQLLSPGDVHNGAEDKRSLLGHQRIETNLYGKLAAIFATPKQIAPRAHGPNLRVGKKTRPVIGMLSSEAIRHEQLHRLSQ